jgi:hypothetical protein
MNPRVSLAALGLAVAFAAAPGALHAQFEGTADFKITSQNEAAKGLESAGKIHVSRAGFRMEWDMAVSRTGSAAAPQHRKITMVGKKGDPDHMYVINDEKKTYSVMDLKKLREESSSLEETKSYTVQKLGSDTVAGLRCQKASVTTSRGMVFDVCTSKEWGADADLISALTRNRHSGSWFAALRDQGVEGFPIRFGFRSRADAPPTMIFEITHIERKAPPASLFDVPPAGYSQTGSAMGALSPEQQKAIDDAKSRMRENMTPEQRKAYEESLRRRGETTPAPTPNP